MHASSFVGSGVCFATFQKCANTPPAHDGAYFPYRIEDSTSDYSYIHKSGRHPELNISVI
jgi:hypothetical protein